MLWLAVLFAQTARHAVEIITEVRELIVGANPDFDVEVACAELMGCRGKCFERSEVAAQLYDRQLR